MLTKDELKVWLHRKEFGHRDKLLLVLATFDKPCQVKDILRQSREAGLRIPTKWNPSAVLARSDGQAIRAPEGWEITNAGRQHLRNLGVTRASPAAVQVAADLRSQISNINDEDTRTFVEEAIKCYELEFYRSAVVMSWLAAVHVLQRTVISGHATEFNAEAKRLDPRWKDAKTSDDLGRMKESDFLDRLVSVSLIGRNVKTELKGCLDFRNACGHPNSMKIGPNMVARHLESLLLNVFKKFQL